MRSSPAILSAAGAKDLLAVALMRSSPAIVSAAGAKDLLAVALMRSSPAIVSAPGAKGRAQGDPWLGGRAQAGPSLARVPRASLSMTMPRGPGERGRGMVDWGSRGTFRTLQELPASAPSAGAFKPRMESMLRQPPPGHAACTWPRHPQDVERTQ